MACRAKRRSALNDHRPSKCCCAGIRLGPKGGAVHAHPHSDSFRSAAPVHVHVAQAASLRMTSQVVAALGPEGARCRACIVVPRAQERFALSSGNAAANLDVATLHMHPATGPLGSSRGRRQSQVTFSDLPSLPSSSKVAQLRASRSHRSSEECVLESRSSVGKHVQLVRLGTTAGRTQRNTPVDSNASRPVRLPLSWCISQCPLCYDHACNSCITRPAR